VDEHCHQLVGQHHAPVLAFVFRRCNERRTDHYSSGGRRSSCPGSHAWSVLAGTTRTATVWLTCNAAAASERAASATPRSTMSAMRLRQQHPLHKLLTSSLPSLTRCARAPRHSKTKQCKACEHDSECINRSCVRAAGCVGGQQEQSLHLKPCTRLRSRRPHWWPETRARCPWRWVCTHTPRPGETGRWFRWPN